MKLLNYQPTNLMKLLWLGKKCISSILYLKKPQSRVPRDSKDLLRTYLWLNTTWILWLQAYNVFYFVWKPITFEWRHTCLIRHRYYRAPKEMCYWWKKGSDFILRVGKQRVLLPIFDTKANEVYFVKYESSWKDCYQMCSLVFITL